MGGSNRIYLQLPKRPSNTQCPPQAKVIVALQSHVLSAGPTTLGQEEGEWGLCWPLALAWGLSLSFLRMYQVQARKLQLPAEQPPLPATLTPAWSLSFP